MQNEKLRKLLPMFLVLTVTHYYIQLIQQQDYKTNAIGFNRSFSQESETSSPQGKVTSPTD